MHIKELIKRTTGQLLRRAYRQVAPPDMTLFELNDTSDPLFGIMTGTPVDRFLIEDFLSREMAELKLDRQFFTSLEVGEIKYSKMFVPNALHHVLTFDKDRPIMQVKPDELRGDLQSETEIHSMFDVIILTQVLSFIDNYEGSLQTLFNILKPGGILIGTEPHLTPISIFDESRWGEWNRFTQRRLQDLLGLNFESVKISCYGNAYTSAALILGIPFESLDKSRLNPPRPSHATILTYTATKSLVHPSTETGQSTPHK